MHDSTVHYLGCRIHKNLLIAKIKIQKKAHVLILAIFIHLLVQNAVSILGISTTYLQNEGPCEIRPAASANRKIIEV